MVSTNCNGDVRAALWAFCCTEDAGLGCALLGSARTLQRFNPCELLADNARSELLPGCRQRPSGGGGELKK